jgi:alkylated DNA repair dioxygenase AlkB
MLFPPEVAREDVPDIPGLSYRPNYITPAEEAELVAAIDQEDWDTTWDRRRQPYGAAYGAGAQTQRPIPAWGQKLAQRMHWEGISERVFDQLLINEYLPGQGIALHRDYSPFDRTVVSLSLLSPCVMDFRRADGQVSASLQLEPRSLLVLSDAARYQWQHGIARRKNDRWHGLLVPRSRRLSVTFRLLKQAERT